MITQSDVDLANAAILQKLLSKEEATECFRQLKGLAQAGKPKTLAAYLIDKGVLTHPQVDALSAMNVPRSASAVTPPAPATTPVAAAAPPVPPARPERGASGASPESKGSPADHASTRAPAAPSLSAGGKTSPPPSQSTPAAKPGGTPPQPVPGMQIVGKLGSGGMATVFRAVREEDQREVALKIMYPHHVKNPLFLARFVREAELLCSFEHANIVKGVAHGCSNGLYYLAMDLIEGKSVQAMITERGTLDEETALNIIVQIARALEYMQSQGIVHRDIKPDNILMPEDGVLKLCDLGFAKQIGATEGAESMTCGTPQYMSPEQAQGQGDLDVRSDIYSLGATMYHMVLGEVPFTGSDNMEIMAAQCLAELKSSAVKSGTISQHMHYFIEKMMAKEKEIRYQNAAEVVEDIQAQIEGYKSLQYDPDAEEAPAKSAPARRPPSSFGRPGPARRPLSDFGKRPPGARDSSKFFRRPK